MNQMIFEKNIEALKLKNSSLAEKLVNIDISDRYTVSKNKNNETVVEIKNSKKRLISKYDPKRDAKKAIENLDFDVNAALYVVMGLEWGYKLREIYKKRWDKMKILVIERSLELFKLNLMYQDYTEILNDKNVLFSVGEYEEDYLKNLQDILYDIFYIIIKVCVTKPTSNVNEDIVFFKKNADFIIESKENYSFKLGNCPDDTLVGLKNRFENIVNFIDKPGVNDLLEKYEGIYTGKPAVVVASGPSLEKNIKYLKEYQDKILILSCDGSYKRLKMEGIKAHAIGSIERVITTYEAFYKGQEKTFDDDLIMLSPAVVRKDIIDIFEDRFISFYKPDTHGGILECIDEKGKFFNGASVAHLLFGFADRMGCNPVILIGQDLAYSKEGVSHANGVATIEYKKDNEYKCYVKDYEGNDLGSTEVWCMFKNIYEEAIRKAKCKVIDATEGGAFIEGTAVKELKETLEKYCKEEITPLYKLYKDLNYKNKKSEEVKKKLLDYIFEEYKLLLKLNKNNAKYRKNLRKSLKILESNFSEKELDWVYDTVFGVDEEIIKPIIKSPYIYLILAYPISNAIRMISMLKAKEYNQDILIKNIEIQQKLLKIVETYVRKTLRVTYIGLKEILENAKFSNIKIENIDLKKMEKEIEFVLDNKKYFLPKI